MIFITVLSIQSYCSAIRRGLNRPKIQVRFSERLATSLNRSADFSPRVRAMIETRGINSALRSRSPRDFDVARAFMLHLHDNATGGQFADGVTVRLESVHAREFVPSGCDM